MIRLGAAAAILLAGGVATAAELELRLGGDALDHDLPRWREASLRVAGALPLPRDAGVGVVASRIERFGWLDHGAAADLHARVGARWVLALDAAASPTHHVIPVWSAGVRAGRDVARGLVASGGVRWSRYDGDAAATSVAISDLGLELYRSAHRLSFTAYVARVEGTWAPSFAASWDVFFRARDRIGLVLSAGREAEAVGGGRVLSMDVVAVALLGRTAVDARWSLTYGVEARRQGELYSRAGGRLGVVREF